MLSRCCECLHTNVGWLLRWYVVFPAKKCCRVADSENNVYWYTLSASMFSHVLAWPGANDSGCLSSKRLYLFCSISKKRIPESNVTEADWLSLVCSTSSPHESFFCLRFSVRFAGKLGEVCTNEFKPRSRKTRRAFQLHLLHHTKRNEMEQIVWETRWKRSGYSNQHTSLISNWQAGVPIYLVEVEPGTSVFSLELK